MTISVLHRAISKYWAVIASAAKQSRGHSTRPLNCFVSRAPRNDGQWWCSRSTNSTFLFLGFALSRRDGEAERLRCGSSAEVAHGRPRGRVPHLVGSRLPRRYHFRARIQSFQAVAAPFPGDPTPELLFDGCGISRVAVKTNNSSINLEFLAPRGCCGARRVSRARWIGISEPTSSDASTYLVFPKEKSRKDRRRRFREIPPSRRRPKP